MCLNEDYKKKGGVKKTQTTPMYSLHSVIRTKMEQTDKC